MDLFIQAFISFGSYLLLTYFIYSILNRNRTIPLFIFGLILVSQIIELIRWIQLGASGIVVLFRVMSFLLPVLLALFVFMRLTGGFIKLSIQRGRPIKGIKTDIQTVYQTEIISLILSAIGILFGLLGYFVMNGWMRWMILVFGVFAFIAGIFLFIKQRQIMSEKVLLLVGKLEKKYYVYDIPKKHWTVKTKAFFKNDNYIVDPIGLIHYKDQMKKVSIYYVYWIATQEKIDMTLESQLTPTSLFFETYLDHFEKYHYRILHLKETQKGLIELSMIKQIK